MSCTSTNGMFLAGMVGRRFPGRQYPTGGRCCGVARGPAKTGCSFLHCYRTRRNYVNYVINGSYSGRNAVRSAFYSNCIPR